MLFYDMRKILKRVGSSSKQILLAFRAHASSRLVESVRDPLYRFSQMDFSGTSFMLNPHELIRNWHKWRPREIAEYIALASYRSYSDYLLNNQTTLDLFHSPVSEDNIHNNRLLRIVKDRVHFYYEEDLRKREKLWQD